MLVEHPLRLLQVLFVYGKCNILGIFPADGLQDQIHVDVVPAEQVEHLERHAGVVLQPHQGDPCNADVLCHTGNIGFLHFCNLLDFRTGLALQAGQHFQVHPELFRQLHAAVVQYLRALAGQLQHFVIGDLVQLSGIGHQTRVRSVNAVHIRVDLAQLCVEGRRQRHGTGIGAAPAQGRHIPLPVHSLEAGDQNDAVLVQLRADALGVDPLDAGVGMDAGRLDAHLPGGQGHTGQSHGLQCHGAQRHGDLLAGGKQHIHLPLGGVGVDLLRLGNEIVCSVALGGEDHNHVVPRQIGLCDDAGYVADALGISHAGAAEFLYDQAHGISFFKSESSLKSRFPPVPVYTSSGGLGLIPAPADRPGRAGLRPASLPRLR